MLGLLVPLLNGCDLPGRPKPGPEVPRPEAVLSFETLYSQNCAGCHGANGQNGSATDLANPEYEALIDDASLRDVIAKGEKGTLMPAFGAASGGPLTDAQIDAVVLGMRIQWKKGNALAGLTPPPYKAARQGDTSKGQSVYSAACARCHGDSDQHPGQAGSILDGSFLALVNEQTLRTTIIAGRPDIAQPDWRGQAQGRALRDDEITDVCAWLIAQRPVAPGQPYGSGREPTNPEVSPQPATGKPPSH